MNTSAKCLALIIRNNAGLSELAHQAKTQLKSLRRVGFNANSADTPTQNGEYTWTGSVLYWQVLSVHACLRRNSPTRPSR